MTLDVFRLKDSVVSEYREYLQSFIQVLDPRIDNYVKDMLHRGTLWPEAVLQLNPAFEMDETLAELAKQGLLTEKTAQFFGPQLCLYRHQREALEIGLQGESYVVTTSTGSGKSLTYLLPIYDTIIRNNPSEHSVRALLIYPMNALINSQLEALQRFKTNNYPNSPISFASYTGQTSEEERDRIQKEPPHILLTNYMMAEYLLLRPSDRSMLDTATQNLQTLVMDELHVYRGRQGADVAMLTRRLQDVAGRTLQTVATSATIASRGDGINSREEQKATVAWTASRFFGQNIPPTNVVDETLRRVAEVTSPQTEAALQAAIEAPLPKPSPDEVKTHPLTAWAEEAFGITTQDGRLVRRPPETFADATRRLSEASKLSLAVCEQQLEGILEAGSQALSEGLEPVLAFRLHQWLASGGNISATLESDEAREFTMDGQYRLDEERLLFPLSFCRECGQEYYMVILAEEFGQKLLLPRAPAVGATDESIDGQGGFFALDVEGLWAGDPDELPEAWFTERRNGRTIKRDYADFVPTKYLAHPSGNLENTDSTASPDHQDGEENASATVAGWYQPQPFLLCLRCRAHYDRRQGEYRKLSSLSQTGRSTATTISVNAAVSAMAEQGLPAGEAKALSFTDNRQDASLQSGHLNDFVQVATLRAGLVEALRRNGPLTFDVMGPQIFDALELRPEDFLLQPVDTGPGYEQGKRAMVDLLEYLLLEDLSRGWRITQPNLEQTGQLSIEYPGLSEIAFENSQWHGLPAISDADPELRNDVLTAFLGHLRMNLIIDANPLTPDTQRSLTHRANQWLKDPWRLEENDILARQGLALLPGKQRSTNENNGRSTMSLGARSTILRHLRSQHTWGIDQNLGTDEGELLVNGIINRLRGQFLSVITGSRGEERGVRLLAAGMQWVAGDGTPVSPDPVRTRSLYLRKEIPGSQRPNHYFTALYANKERQLRGMLAAPHSGQVSAADREIREKQFREGTLSALFCSPTMELGVDISDLDAVHMRNIPPTPANYAQRSGRAGRGGRPALIVAFAAQGNAHDQYYFSRRNEMIAGAVAPARMDLRNQELIKAHLYSTWLATTGIALGRGMQEILDLSTSGYPIKSDIAENIKGDRRELYYERALVRAHNIINQTPDVKDAPWFSENWIEDTVSSAPEEFDHAFDRWRDLYRAACTDRDAARLQMDDPNASQRMRREAEQRESGTRREVTLLLNQTNRQEESDFYPYRYLAGEGFLPGYNFPRLPVRVSVPVRDSTHMIDRPRFLGLNEFGPRNQVYHEGRKYRIDSAIIPPSGIQEAFRQALLCNTCGYAHHGDDLQADLCQNCHSKLDGGSDFPQKLLEQPTMRAQRRERISSEEEERVRNGYRVTTHFNFGPGKTQSAQVRSQDGEVILNALFAPSAELWRINHGWRQSEQRDMGFTIDPVNGRWESRNGSDDVNDDPAVSGPVTGVKPYVHDSRNVLFLQHRANDPSEQFQVTLLHAIKRAIQFVYQVEDQEIAAELIGKNQHRQMILWEAAEGGIGVWEHLINDPEAFAKVARMALHLCHQEECANEGDAQRTPCVSACYDCLLTYSNQLEHRMIDRRLILDFLGSMTTSTTRLDQEPDYEEQYQRLLQMIDPTSSLEKEFLNVLKDNQLRLPDTAQNRPTPLVFVQPDFYYERENRHGICIFIDGPAHDSPDRQHSDQNIRNELQDLGFRVIAISHNRPIMEQVYEHPDVFVTVV